MIQTTLEKINTFNFYGSLQVILISSWDFQFFPFFAYQSSAKLNDYTMFHKESLVLRSEPFCITLTGYLCCDAQWSQRVLGLFWLTMSMAGCSY